MDQLRRLNIKPLLRDEANGGQTRSYILETAHRDDEVFKKVDLSRYFGGPRSRRDGADSPGSTSPTKPDHHHPADVNVLDNVEITPTPTSEAPPADSCLLVDISDALSEKDRVKFTVHTRTTLPGYAKRDFHVVRQHEEFVWLHDRFEENDAYAGYIIPPCPPRPDFDASREKLQRLGEGEGNMTKEEFKKMKQELEAEYLATFKKTVAMHEVFLTRLASHPVFRADEHLKVFLEYDQDLCAKPRKKLDIFGGFVRNLGKTTDEIYLGATVRDVNDFFENELQFLTEYHANLKEAASRTEKMTKKHKEVAEAHQKISHALVDFAAHEPPGFERFLVKASDVFEKIKNMEQRVASDTDLKLGDTLRYYQRESHAAKALLIRRLKCLSEYEAANRNLEKARAKNKDVHAAEAAQTAACEKFEAISARAKEELIGFRARREQAFKKNLTELAELNIKHAKAHYECLRQSVLALKELSEENKRQLKMPTPPDLTPDVEASPQGAEGGEPLGAVAGAAAAVAPPSTKSNNGTNNDDDTEEVDLTTSGAVGGSGAPATLPLID